MDEVHYFTVQDKSAFIPLRYVYPECYKLIEPHPQMHPMKCLQSEGCPANVGCMEILVQRVKYLFTEVMPSVEMLVAYFKYDDRPKSIRGVVFHSDLRAPRLLLLNPFGMKRLQLEGTVCVWTATEAYNNIKPHTQTIPTSRLIRD